nr:hypothetical protein Iba_chr01bCG8840 [Ipomoea batatas]GMC51479.1 hypothetical protein Iba_chr01cCG6680 [Ipomoea batatas]
MGLRITNCKHPCLHLRMTHPSNGIGGKQHVMRQQLGFRTRPLKFSTTAPGPPTHAKHSDRKLYITQASYISRMELKYIAFLSRTSDRKDISA